MILSAGTKKGTNILIRINPPLVFILLIIFIVFEEIYLLRDGYTLQWWNTHRRKLPVNHPVFTVVMIIYHYVEIIWITLVTPNFWYNIFDHE